MRAAALFVFVGLSACSKREEPPPPAPAPSAAAKAEPKVVPPLLRLPAPERLVAIGDLHGDLPATRAALTLAGAVNAEHDWAGGRLVVVQTGDQLDRGDDDRALLDYLERLGQQAKAQGGALLVLNGNHEVMNVQGDFRYATPGSNAAFADAQGRSAAFAPGGRYARVLAERPVVAVVGDSVFVHGGLLPDHVRYGLDRLNAELSAWMRGETLVPPALAIRDDAPLWTRVYGAPDVAAGDCSRLSETLGALNVRRLVIGHTVQERGINSACGGKVWRIDVGLSRYYGKGRPPQVLEITAKGERVLGAGTPRAENSLPPPALVPP